MFKVLMWPIVTSFGLVFINLVVHFSLATLYRIQRNRDRERQTERERDRQRQRERDRDQ